MNANTTSPLQAARLDAAPRTDAAGNPLTRWTLTLGVERAFQDVDQWGLPYDGSPDGGLHDDLCDWLTTMGRLDMGALNAL
nr:MAG TPA: hypothetical protein [Caudoviricetes sp.]